MKSISITGTKRADLGKKATKEVRKQGLVPCVIYGEKKDANGAPEALHFLVDEKQINKVVYTPDIYLVNINIDGQEYQAVVKEIQLIGRPPHSLLLRALPAHLLSSWGSCAYTRTARRIFSPHCRICGQRHLR